MIFRQSSALIRLLWISLAALLAAAGSVTAREGACLSS